MKTIAEQLGVTDFPFIIADKNDLVIYVEHSNRFWERHEYDSNGNEKYFENSDGYYCEREFDSDGIVTFYKNSDGFIIGKQSGTLQVPHKSSILRKKLDYNLHNKNP